MGYTPEYAKGQILVEFKGNCGVDKARYLGEGLGYVLSDEEYPYCEYHIFETEEGKEGAAIEIFAKYREFVKHVCRRDVKMETRWNKLEELAIMVENLNNNVELSDENYNQRLDEITDYIKS